jgi:hypothetical protein
MGSITLSTVSLGLSTYCPFAHHDHPTVAIWRSLSLPSCFFSSSYTSRLRGVVVGVVVGVLSIDPVDRVLADTKIRMF